MAAIWQRAWRSKKVSSPGLGNGTGGGSLWPISGSTTTTTTTSGTILSTTTYTTISSDPVGERPLVEVVEESADEGLVVDAMEFKEELAETRRHLRGLVQEFCGGASAPDRWLSELNVAWLLHLAELGASARGSFISQQLLQRLVQSWILALRQINSSIWACFSGFSSQEEATVAPPAAPEFVRFIEATLLKMLTFVDAINAPLNADDPSSQEHVVSRLIGQLRALLDVRDALSSASEQIMMSFRSSPYVQSTRITDDMGGLLSAELGKLDRAVSDTEDHIRTAIRSSLDNDSSCSWGTAQILQPSPNIHKVTRSVVDCIEATLLPADYAHHQRYGDAFLLTRLKMEMVTSLEEKLTREYQSFPDQSLRFLFLINNISFIRQQLHHNNLTHKIERYIESYLQVSWEPVLKCLNNPTFHCFTRSSVLPKFESKFQATYDAQKLCKVPDPQLRKRLREAIIEKVVSGFTKYFEDNSRITPRVFTPQVVEEMLQELFEG